MLKTITLAMMGIMAFESGCEINAPYKSIILLLFGGMTPHGLYHTVITGITGCLSGLTGMYQNLFLG